MPAGQAGIRAPLGSGSSQDKGGKTVRIRRIIVHMEIDNHAV